LIFVAVLTLGLGRGFLNLIIFVVFFKEEAISPKEVEFSVVSLIIYTSSIVDDALFVRFDRYPDC